MDSFYNWVCIRVQGSPDDFRKDRGICGTAHRTARKPKVITALCLALLLLASGTPVRSQQRVYFVDGYHGGVYGHYPVAWKTRFITDQMAAHPEWRIGLEIEPETWDTVEVRTPADYARFKAIAADRRVGIHQPVLCPALLLQHLGRKHHPAVRIRHAEDPQSFPRRGVRHLLRRGAVLHQLPAANPETLRVQIRLPEMSEYLLGRVHGALRRRTGQLGRPRRQFDPHFAAPRLRRAPEKLGMADHGMGQ